MSAPVTEDAIERVRASFSRQGLMQHLGATLGSIEAGAVTILLPARPAVSQQHGFVHAGATSAIADSAGGYAALTLMGEGSEVLTIEYKVNLLAPARGERLEATGTVVRAGRTISVCALDVHAIDGTTRTHVATGQQTLMRIDSSDRQEHR